MPPSTTKLRPPKPAKVTPLPQYPEIILSLNLLRTNPVAFHWLLFIPNPGATRAVVTEGMKLHAVDNGQKGTAREWSYDFASFTLATSASVAVAMVLGKLPSGKTVQDLDALLQKIPMTVPAADTARESEFTCRVWVREAVRRMHAEGYIVCPDVDALEEEAWKYGREAARKVDDDTFELATLVYAQTSRAVQCVEFGARGGRTQRAVCLETGRTGESRCKRVRYIM
ncbi:hypothetical protein TRAPUB_202 [Trametes pubescens]|uniref:Uncharacterized protein n=1 Tax=Trametes pubescens TaxID=154538 RepID=A0A1M2VMM5_TRAPU|nr:hypothetical protein TRAPUB_202 [Trametes pubescens]